MNEDLKSYFGAGDAVVFAGSLMTAVCIGIYFAYKDRNKKTTKNYLYGNRNLSPYAVALSISVSYISAITAVIFPLEAYMQGAIFLWLPIIAFPTMMLISFKFVPMIYHLDMRTIFELIYMSVAVYLPSLALSSVTPISLLWSIFLTTAICTFYTTLGGMKAVIWTDALQAIVMFSGMMGVFIRLVILVGGMENVARAVERGGRDNFFKPTGDFRERNSIVAYIFGYSTIYFAYNSTSQVQWQRFLSCRSAKDAGKAARLAMISIFILVGLAVGIGLSMYAYYEGCDPLSAEKIERPDQVVPIMVVEIYKGYGGLTGLYVAAAYSGTLSTVSSGINSIAAVVVNDYVSVLRPNLSIKRKFLISRICSGVVGCSVLGIAMIVSTQRKTILDFTFVLDGCVSGPVFGVFVLAAMIPVTNAKGAIAGMACGVTMAIWVSVGKVVYGGHPDFPQALNVSTEACNITFIPANVTNTASPAGVVESRPMIADTLYAVSPFFIGSIGLLATLLGGIIVSLITGRTKSKDIDPKMFIPILESKIFPKKVLNFFRFGVPEKKKSRIAKNLPNNDKELVAIGFQEKFYS